jgi:hypothetical protein
MSIKISTDSTMLSGQIIQLCWFVMGISLGSPIVPGTIDQPKEQCPAESHA